MFATTVYRAYHYVPYYHPYHPYHTVIRPVVHTFYHTTATAAGSSIGLLLGLGFFAALVTGLVIIAGTTRGYYTYTYDYPVYEEVYYY